MNGHEGIRELLALAAAGALDESEERRVQNHVRTCEDCRRELESWQAYASELRRTRIPPRPPRLAERTRDRILAQRAAAEDRTREALFMATLAAFSWILGLSGWLIVRVFSGDALTIMGLNLTQALTWAVVSTGFVWLTAAAPVLAFGRLRRQLRREL